MPAIELAETPEEKPQLLLPQRTFNRGRMMRTIRLRSGTASETHALAAAGCRLRARRFRARGLTGSTPANPHRRTARRETQAFDMANRLAGSGSPYLRQHAENPVDWYPWSEEALTRARGERKPILLSIGYSACHWCHVMAHESFENPDVARVMNELSSTSRSIARSAPISTRSTRPRRHDDAPLGGWPLTMFLTPDGDPFYGGTYFPNQGRYGLTGFLDLLPRVATAYREQGAAIAQQGARLAEALRSLEPTGTTGELPATASALAFDGLKLTFDSAEGDSAEHPSFRIRPNSRSAFGKACAATVRRWRSCARPSRGWPKAASTTSSAAASAATAWMPSGRFRTSRRCSTTTDRCWRSTRTSRASMAIARAPASRTASSHG